MHKQVTILEIMLNKVRFFYGMKSLHRKTNLGNRQFPIEAGKNKETNHDHDISILGSRTITDPEKTRKPGKRTEK